MPLPDSFRAKNRPTRIDLETADGLKVVRVALIDGFWVIEFRAPRDTIGPVERERAAAWLKSYFPCLSHDERYYLIFPNADRSPQ